MAIIDALTYVIEADASRLDREIDQSEQHTKDLENSLKHVENQSKKTSLSFGTFVRAAIGYMGALLSVSKAISASNDRADFVANLVRVSDATNTAIEDVDAFGKALETMGGSADGAGNTLQNLAVKVGEALNNVNSAQAKIFAELGVSLTDTQGNVRATIDVMRDLSSAVEGMSQGQAISYLNKLGINDRESIDLILRGRQELDRLLRLQRESGVVTRESAESAKQYNEALYRLRQGFGSVGDSIIDRIIPILTVVINWLGDAIDWFGRHEHVAKGGLIAIASVIAAIYVPSMLSAAAATLAATWPMLLIGAAIAAAAALFVLLYDDIMNFIDGNDSLIGQIIEKYPVVGEVIETLGNIFGFLFELFTVGVRQMASDFQAMASGLVAAAQWLGGMISGIFGGIIDIIQNALGVILSVWDTAKGIVSSIGDKFSGAVDWAFGTGDADADLAFANTSMAHISANPLNSVTPSAIAGSRSEQNIQIDNITVQTQATDAQGISEGIGSELQGQLQSLQAESSSGFDA